MAEIVDIDFVKTTLNISTTIYDTQITNLIPLVEADYLRIRNIPWDTDDSDVTEYPAGSNVTASEMIGTKLKPVTEFDPDDYGKVVSSESLDDHSISYAIGTGSGGSVMYGYPKDIISSIEVFCDASGE